jgi:hypothetical protein
VLKQGNFSLRRDVNDSHKMVRRIHGQQSAVMAEDGPSLVVELQPDQRVKRGQVVTINQSDVTANGRHCDVAAITTEACAQEGGAVRRRVDTRQLVSAPGLNKFEQISVFVKRQQQPGIRAELDNRAIQFETGECPPSFRIEGVDGTVLTDHDEHISTLYAIELAGDVGLE